MTTTTPAAGTGQHRPLRRDAERNRARIIAAAREVLAERGVALTLNDVAHHAGVGVGTVYRHFPDKDGLVDAALADQLEALLVVVSDGLDAPTGWDGLVQVLTRGMAAHVANRGVRDVALAAPTGEHQVAVIDRIVPMVETMIARAQAEGSLRADVTMADVTMIHFMVTEFADHSADVRPDAYLRYLRLLIGALRARPGDDDVEAPLTDDDARAVAEHWIAAHRNRAR